MVNPFEMRFEVQNETTMESGGQQEPPEGRGPKFMLVELFVSGSHWPHAPLALVAHTILMPIMMPRLRTFDWATARCLAI